MPHTPKHAAHAVHAVPYVRNTPTDVPYVCAARPCRGRPGGRDRRAVGPRRDPAAAKGIGGGAHAAAGDAVQAAEAHRAGAVHTCFCRVGGPCVVHTCLLCGQVMCAPHLLAVWTGHVRTTPACRVGGPCVVHTCLPCGQVMCAPHLLAMWTGHVRTTPACRVDRSYALHTCLPHSKSQLARVRAPAAWGQLLVQAECAPAAGGWGWGLACAGGWCVPASRGRCYMSTAHGAVECRGEACVCVSAVRCPHSCSHLPGPGARSGCQVLGLDFNLFSFSLPTLLLTPPWPWCSLRPPGTGPGLQLVQPRPAHTPAHSSLALVLAPAARCWAWTSTCSAPACPHSCSHLPGPGARSGHQ
eukprot:355656-Chlamydomonas_euryale.AAC.1